MARLGLRERKKLQMRAEIVAAAERLFVERGFDNVTIPQVADEVGVSVKTIFNYFRLKEDLAFAAEDEICAAWVHCVRRRPFGTTPFDAVREQILVGMSDEESIGRLLEFQALVDSSRVLVARQRMVWDRLEVSISQVLLHESVGSGRESAATTRFAAAQLVNVLRLLHSAEVRQLVGTLPPAERVAALGQWLDDVLGLVGSGLDGRFVRSVRRNSSSVEVLGSTRLPSTSPVDPGSVPPRSNSASTVRVVDSPRVTLLARAMADDPDALERFWVEVASTSTPLIERDEDPEACVVTFLWRGTASTVGVVVRANKLFDANDPDSGRLRRLEDSDVWHLSYRLPARWRGSYLFVVDDDGSGDVVRPDPSNPEHMPQPPGPDKSVVSAPSAPPQQFWSRRPGVARGVQSEHRFDSEILGNSRRMWTWEPPAVEASSPLSLAVLFDGEVWAGSLPVRATFDNLTAASLIAPTLVVMVGSVEPGLRSRELACHRPFVSMLTDELVPWIEQRFDIAEDRARRTVVGQSLGGLSALYTGLVAPASFGAVIAQSASCWWRNGEGERGPEWLTGQVPALDAQPLRCYMEVGTDEGVNVGANHRMRDALVGAGHEVTFHEFVGGHDRACWRGGLADASIALGNGGLDLRDASWTPEGAR